MKLLLLVGIICLFAASAEAHRRPTCRRRGILGTLACRFWRRRKPTCPELPSTGCFQSSNVAFTPVSFGSNNPDWTWTDDGIDFGRPVEYPSTAFNTYAFCIYSALDVEQSQTEAPRLPADGSSSLLLAGLTNFLGFLQVDEVAGTIKYEYGLSSWTAHLLTSSQRANTITQLISVEDGDFNCWGKDVSLIFPTEAQPIDFDTKNGSGGGALGGQLDAEPSLQFAARVYNAFSEGNALDTEEFVTQNGPNAVLKRAIEAGAGTTTGEFTAIYNLGQYSALVILNEIFQGINPAPAFEPSVLSFLNATVGRRDSIITDDAEMTNLLNGDAFAQPNLGAITAISSPSNLNALYGYVLGYQQGVIAFGDITDVLPPIEPDELVCPIYDGYSIATPDLTGAELVPCTYDEDVFDETCFGSLGDQDAIRDSFVLNESVLAGDILTYQNDGFVAGFDFWLIQNLQFIINSEDEFPTLYSFGNGQLQLLNAAVTAAMTATENILDSAALRDFTNAYTGALLFRRSFEEGVEFLLDNPTTPFTSLPTWDFGITPVQ